MCVVSAVSDYYLRTWPQRFPDNPVPWSTDPDTREMLRKVIEQLDAIDKRLKDIECKEPAKEQFLKDIGANI
jgi:hypothetical protein